MVAHLLWGGRPEHRGRRLVALAVAPVSPARATGGLYEITTTQFSISHRDIDCAKDAARVATCTTTVDGKVLEVRLDTSPGAWLSCTATYDARTTACTRTFDYGPGSHRVRLDSLTVPEPAAEQVRDRYPWWAWLFNGPWLPFALGLVARALVTFAVYWTFSFPVTLVVAPWDGAAFSWYSLLVPHSVLLPARLALGWRLVVGGSVTGATGQRIRLTAVGVLTTLLCSPMLVLVLALRSGMPD
ncbi:hypothetical protein [Saccharothrix syringae]|uniref:Uncharacterized protein n=1 Tax=Saccharothrix syringae TaxID=103733 RepID=A0A5Q0GYS7_SACSY|nr:hypothetical protein [Saccharothrix syringae]QFZ19206.1 hypothetical protein EKG83_18720 [Saccharothrix syringae]